MEVLLGTYFKGSHSFELIGDPESQLVSRVVEFVDLRDDETKPDARHYAIRKILNNDVDIIQLKENNQNGVKEVLFSLGIK